MQSGSKRKELKGTGDDSGKHAAWQRLRLAQTGSVCSSQIPRQGREVVPRLTDILLFFLAICYSSESKQTPKICLHLVLILWRQFRLLRETIPTTRTSADRLYGDYHHDLLHAPDQLMLTSLRSGKADAPPPKKKNSRNSQSSHPRAPADRRKWLAMSCYGWTKGMQVTKHPLKSMTQQFSTFIRAYLWCMEW